MHPETLFDEVAITALIDARHRDPHTLLGAHSSDRGVVVRVCRPDVESVTVVPLDPKIAPVIASALRGSHLFEARFPEVADVFVYTLELSFRDVISAEKTRIRDPYSFWPTVGARDLAAFATGDHPALFEVFGAQPREVDGVAGTSFVVWAPQASSVRVAGDFNRWEGRCHPMRCLSDTGVWEIFIPGVDAGAVYKFEVVSAVGKVLLKSDPFAFRAELRPQTASIVHRRKTHPWGDDAWMNARKARDPLRQPMSIYEVHLGGFMRNPQEKGPGAVVLGNRADAPHTGRFLTYDELAGQLIDHCKRTGFTHVELMPITEHPYDGSWGYQVTGYYAATSRFGDVDGLARMIDRLHQADLGVLLDWVPAHFPKDAHGLARFDGTCVYEHMDPRKGEHADWGTLIFNYGRPEVKNFLISSALYWMRELHFDGIRVDAVTSMLYLDYNKADGDWVPNEHGGRENLEAIAFLRELNTVVRHHCPGAITVAEESTSWPNTTKPTYLGGLGFTMKWNMGWMNDTLAYIQTDPILRSHEHGKITFGLWYAWNEAFILPLSHDEVVHLKRSMIGKMPGDLWQRFATLRALYAMMWAHPGKKLLFMGQEFAQDREFAESESIGWHLLERPRHAQVMATVTRINEIYRSEPALYEADGDSEGFTWIDANDLQQSVFSWVRTTRGLARTLAMSEADRARAKRTSRSESPMVCLVNMTPIVRRDYKIGLPVAGRYEIVVNTDDAWFGGSGVAPLAESSVEASTEASHGFPASLMVTLPPLATVWLRGPKVDVLEAPPSLATPAKGSPRPS